MEQLYGGYTLELNSDSFPLSTDSMVLAHFARLPKNARVLDLGAGCGAGQGGTAGIGEKIQHFDRLITHGNASADQFCAPVPVDCLFREKPCMFETKRL